MRKNKIEKLVFWIIRAATYSVVAIVGYILVDIIIKGLPTLSWEFIFGFPRRSGAEGGILPAIVGTAYLVLGAIIVALPLGDGQCNLSRGICKPRAIHAGGPIGDYHVGRCSVHSIRPVWAGVIRAVFWIRRIDAIWKLDIGVYDFAYDYHLQ